MTSLSSNSGSKFRTKPSPGVWTGIDADSQSHTAIFATVHQVCTRDKHVKRLQPSSTGADATSNGVVRKSLNQNSMCCQRRRLEKPAKISGVDASPAGRPFPNRHDDHRDSSKPTFRAQAHSSSTNACLRLPTAHRRSVLPAGHGYHIRNRRWGQATAAAGALGFRILCWCCAAAAGSSSAVYAARKRGTSGDCRCGYSALQTRS